MSLKTIKEYMERGRVIFGIRQCLKNKEKLKEVFIAKNAREETMRKLEASDIKYNLSRKKEELKDELNLKFTCEVFSILK